MKTMEQHGMYASFPRSGKDTRHTHYCPGCGHGIINKLVAETCAELGLQDRTVFVDPVGCGVFTYYYWDAAHISAAHGRASAVATGVARARPEAVVIAYQGDGDLGAIGFNNAFQAASRGERFGCIFVNNSLYAMTGGQMAPTTLDGEKTTTTPFGRDPALTGAPLHVCEVFDKLDAPVYIARVSVAGTQRIMQAKKAIRKVFEIQRDGLGYAMLEILAPCPTNLKASPLKAQEFCATEMEKEFTLAVFRDRTAGATPAKPREIPRAASCAELFGGAAKTSGDAAGGGTAAVAEEKRFKFAGYGGQGILSLGLCIAEAALHEGLQTLWYPSYGPEQRGGSANCSVVVSGSSIGAPAADRPDVLVCMNQPAFERFAGDVPPGGTIVVDESVPEGCAKTAEGVRTVRWPAIRLAAEMGVPKAANTMMLAALAKLGCTGLARDSLEKALVESFKKKPELGEKNREIFAKAVEKAEDCGL